MKGIVLAGGNGTRLRPLTNIVNKHLIAVYDRPMIEYPLKTLTDMGITDILMVSGREHAGSFVEYLGSGADRGLNLTYRVQEAAGGIAEALGLAEDFAAGEGVVVILGDNYFEDPKISLEEDNMAGVVLKEVPDPQLFGVATVLASGRIASIHEKPKEPESNLAVTGLYVYPNDVFAYIRTLEPSDRGELEITDLNNAYIAQNRMTHSVMSGFWSDMGTPESLARTIQHILSK